jgi:hypothetical protein
MHIGKPPFDANVLEPLMPDRAGIKFGWIDMTLLILKNLPSLPKMYSNRPSVVDARAHEVCIHIYRRNIVPSTHL